MKNINTILSKGFILIMAIITLFPFTYMVLSSLMTYQEVTSIPPTLFPEELQWNNYKEAMSKAPFARYFYNTIVVSCATTFGTLVTSVLASFAFVKLEFKGKNILLTFMIALMMVPYEVVVFTNYQTIIELELIDTYTALILPSLASIFYIFYLKGYLTSIPPSYYKAAKVDGCSDIEFITRILIPLIKPALFTTAILDFISSWNGFLWPLLVTNSKDMRLLSNGLSAFSTETGSNIHLQMAASTISILPVVIIYIIFRKQIIRGVIKSGIKG